MVLSKHFHIGMLHPKMNSATFFPSLPVKLFHPSQYTHSICGLNGVLFTHCQRPSGFWYESPRKYENRLSKNWVIKFCIQKIVNSYKFICTYHVIDDRKRGKRLNKLLVKQKGLAPDGSVFISCLCCLLCNVRKCLILTKP